MGRPVEKTFDVCCKTMRGDNLKRHMKPLEKKTYSIDVEKLKNVDQAGGSVTRSVKCTHINFEELEKNIESHVDEFNRKIEFGGNLKTILNKYGYKIHCLSQNMKDALKAYELNGKNMYMKEIIWREGQKDLREYLDNPCDRKIIWIVGMEGNEVKTLFQSNVRE